MPIKGQKGIVSEEIVDRSGGNVTREIHLAGIYTLKDFYDIIAKKSRQYNAHV